MSEQYNGQHLPELLSAYYRFLFPHKKFHKWLSYGNVDKDYFTRREFSFCLHGDIYVRYQSFDDCNEMTQSIMSKLPEKIDMGAVYNMKPKQSKSVGIVTFTAVERELVFDIDITDYDDIRNCCKGADICHNCWPFMTIAAKILDRALRSDFGFKHLLWVYSGRRGIHCWVADQKARKLDNKARHALVEYLSVVHGGQFKTKKVVLDCRNLVHPSIEEAVHIIDKYFDSVVIEKQDILKTSEQIKSVIELCEDLKLRKTLETELLNSNKYRNTKERWNAIKDLTETHLSSFHQNFLYKHQSRHYIKEIKLQYCYPRLDINVTKGLNHLLKIPFSVHPKTGRICVPIEFDSIDSFDPFEVPLINALCAQIDSNCSSDKSRNVYEKTDLFASIKIFDKFIKNIENDFKGERIKMSDKMMEL